MKTGIVVEVDTKRFILPLIVSAAMVMGSAALSNQEVGALYPWTAIFFIIDGRINSTVYPAPLVFGIIGLVSLIGFCTTFRYFYWEDLNNVIYMD